MSSSRVLFAFTLRGLPELAARGFLVYFENRVSAERDRSRGESERFHLRGGAAGARPQRREEH